MWKLQLACKPHSWCTQNLSSLLEMVDKGLYVIKTTATAVWHAAPLMIANLCIPAMNPHEVDMLYDIPQSDKQQLTYIETRLSKATSTHMTW